MDLVQLHAKRLAVSFLMALVAAISALVLVATAPASGAACPSFRVLHNDRIGGASRPAGRGRVSVSCRARLG